MKMTPNPFTQGLANGDQQVGLWISLCSNIAADIVAPSGFDWVLLDMEHSPNDIRTVVSQLQVFEASDSTPIVRPEWNDPVLVKRLLDAGAPGLLFPMIQSVEEAEQAVAATRYPPFGIRGVSGAMRGNKYGRIKDYVKNVDSQTAVLVQLETQHALGQAEAIADVDGVDGVFFGPADIAADLGVLGQPMNSKVWEAILPVAQKLIEKDVPVGTLVLDPQFARDLLDQGFSFVACGSDLSLLARSADELMLAMNSFD